MSWHYSQELGAGFSLPNYLDGLRSARSKSSSTPATSSCDDKKTDTLSHSQSGTMSAPSTESRGEEQLMLFREASPAKTSARRVGVKDLPEPVQDFGLSISESLTRCGLDLSLPRTVRTCVPVGLAPSSKDLPRWGMVFDGACWELGTSVRITSGIGCGYLPTPQASDHITKRTSKSWKEQGRVNFTLSNPEIQKMWPTPTVQDAKNNGSPSQMRRNTKPLNAEVGGRLNPDWVEWLMAWPIGWTDSKPLATDKFRQWRQSHGKH